MSAPERTYSNARLAEQIRAAVKPFNAKIVSLDLKHEEAVARFADRVEEVYRLSRETPARLRRR